MAVLPATGSQISFGQVNRAYTNQTPGATGDAPAGGQNIKLSAVLGSQATYGSLAAPAGSQVSLSATFGGQTTPYS